MKFGFVVPNNFGVVSPTKSLPEYADAGVSELVMSLNTADPTDIETGISRFAAEFIAPGRR